MFEFSCLPRTRLTDLAVLSLEGPDAEAFLHGQISNAVQGMPDDQARLAAYCTAQGRMLANLVVWRTGPEALRLMMARDVIESVAQRLRMFVLRSKVRIQVENTLSIIGCAGPQHCPADAIKSWACGRDDEGEWIAAPAPGSQIRAWRIIQNGLVGDLAGDETWHAADLAAGLPWIRAATQDLFLPTTLDMDLNGGIDFRKGCYPGQEVIARAHYRGAVKRRMAYGTAAWSDSHAQPVPGDDLFEAGGGERPVGRLIDVARVADTLHAAVEITLSDWPAMRYALGAADGPALTLSPPRAVQQAA